jgi:DNA mismatch repair protein MutL
MSIIHVLDEATINQIAAGEVVERPSAVIKELIENAVDAGSTAITAEIKEGGLSLIRITDNGGGIAKEDIPLAFQRHATSKIKTAEDLLSVTSLGFRGEALSSIAAVAQVELITKTQTSLNGYRFIIEGGEEKSFEEIGCPGGTTILVRNIFYNTPARRKFLKSSVTEAGYISDLMERLMVSHPDISFKYIVNGQVKLQSSGNHSMKDILYHVYGRDISKELLPVDFDSENLNITGFIGKPLINRGNRNFENYFINGRYIKSNVITKAIEEAYRPFLMQHKYPFTSLYLKINPSFIDVNVHPQKLEVRLHNNEEIYSLIHNVIRDTLSGKEMIPKVVLTKQEELKQPTQALPEPFEANRRKSITYTEQVRRDTVRENPNYLNPYHNSTPEKSLQFLSTLSKELATESVPSANSKCQEQTIAPSTGTQCQGMVTAPSVGKLSNEQAMAPSTDTHDYAKVTEISMSSNSIEQNMAPSTDTRNNENISVPPSAPDEYFKNLELNDITCPVVSNAAVSFSLKENVVEQNTVHHNLEAKPQPVEKDLVTEQLTLFGQPDSTEQNIPFLSKKALAEHRIIGQVFSTYWLVEFQKELFIIDQHAAHEKVLYEKIMSSALDKTFESQLLMPPIVLSLTLREQEVLSKYEAALNQLGYEFEPFGGNEYSFRAVPANLYGLSEKELLLEFIDDFMEAVGNGTSTPSSVLERIASLSCKAAVKANHAFSMKEAEALIQELLTLENPYHCPHGRPVIISMSQYELEKKFKRVL